MLGGLVGKVLGGVVGGVTDIFTKREDRRMAKQTGKQKLAAAQLTNAHTIELTRAEWEAAMAQASAGSWKDEFWTVILAGPLVLIEIGAVWAVFTEDMRLLNSVKSILVQFQIIGLDYTTILYIAIAAAFGIRWMKR